MFLVSRFSMPPPFGCRNLTYIFKKSKRREMSGLICRRVIEDISAKPLLSPVLCGKTLFIFVLLTSYLKFTVHLPYFCSMKKTGIGTRVLNFIVDTLLIFLISFGVNKGYSFYEMYWHYPFIPFYIFFWGTMFFYYLLFEGFTARSPGKWVSYTKAVNEKGGRPSFIQVFIRSAVRLTVIDCFFYPFLEKTLHDYLSKTDVVEL